MKILFVALTSSVHTVRWISQLNGTGWDIHLFSSENPDTHHPGLRNLTFHAAGFWRPDGLDPSVKVANLWPLPRGAWRVQHLIDRFSPAMNDRSGQLTRVIRRVRPDIVHTLEMQHGGYLTVKSRLRLGQQFPPWIYSAWGSDIYYFRQFEDHAEKIRQVLTLCDYMTADCNRDLRLGKELGFAGEQLGVFPGPGGYELEQMRRVGSPVQLAERKTIALKGYHHDKWAGRALVALEAIHRCADVLRDYEIVIYLATQNVVDVARHVAAVSGLNIKILPQSPHDEIVKLMGRSRIAIGVNVTDGVPNSMLEAMALGALPIQSDTISTAEWITDGENGLLVPPEDSVAIERAIRRAISDDDLVARGAELNVAMVRSCIDLSVVRPKVIAMYERVKAQGKRAGVSL